MSWIRSRGSTCSRVAVPQGPDLHRAPRDGVSRPKLRILHRELHGEGASSGQMPAIGGATTLGGAVPFGILCLCRPRHVLGQNDSVSARSWSSQKPSSAAYRSRFAFQIGKHLSKPSFTVQPRCFWSRQRMVLGLSGSILFGASNLPTRFATLLTSALTATRGLGAGSTTIRVTDPSAWPGRTPSSWSCSTSIHRLGRIAELGRLGATASPIYADARQRGNWLRRHSGI
jgi:hypothetical protein